MRERVLAMRAIWTEDVAAFDGAHVQFDEMWSWPKPDQRPHPPILVGGYGPSVLERVIEYGDEWLAMSVPGTATITERIAELARLAAAAGRPMPRVSIQVYGMPPPEEVIRRYVEAGVDRVDLTLPHGRLDEVRSSLAVLEDVVRRWSSDRPS
jgi:alkanesulfonate monooxygenase SsuD/methylene tetrahydromethanopterin reductase-like flavin-dependent oxidoreductase (luciferase family)